MSFDWGCRCHWNFWIRGLIYFLANKHAKGKAAISMEMHVRMMFFSFYWWLTWGFLILCLVYLAITVLMQVRSLWSATPRASEHYDEYPGQNKLRAFPWTNMTHDIYQVQESYWTFSSTCGSLIFDTILFFSSSEWSQKPDTVLAACPCHVQKVWWEQIKGVVPTIAGVSKNVFLSEDGLSAPWPCV